MRPTDDATSDMIGSTQWDKQIETIVKDMVAETTKDLVSDVRHFEKDMKRLVMHKS